MKYTTKCHLALLACLLTACSGSDDWDDLENYTNTQPPTLPTSGGEQSSQGTVQTGELATFDISINTDEMEETETLPESSDAYYEDYVETYSPTANITITWSGSTATVDGEADGVTVAAENGHVVVNSSAKGLCLTVKGSSDDGSLKIYSEKKLALVMEGLTLHNPHGAAINNQGKRMYVVLADGTSNSLQDGDTYTMTDGEDLKAAFFSEGKLAFSGHGQLSVTATGKNGIASDDYVLIRPNTNIYVKSTAQHGIKTNDGIIVRGGVLNVVTTAAASKAINTEGQARFEGGRTTLVTSGGTAYDSDDREYKGCAALKADSTITLSGGQLLAKSTGAGGKAVSGDQQLVVCGGTLRAIATGQNNNDVSAKAIKMDGDITIEGGDIMARATAHEAIETKGKLTMSAGSVAAYSSDDAINSAKDMTISGGYLYGYSSGNDGIDANGNLTISGGLVIGCGALAPEEGIDAAEGKTLAINGGTVVGIGGGGEALSGSQQKAAISGVTIAGGSYLTVGDGTSNILSLQMPRSYSGATVQLSSPKFSQGTTYVLSSATSSQSATSFFGYQAEATVSGETQLTTFTTSTSTSGGMGGGAMGGGGFPGGNAGGGGRPGGW